MRFFVHFSFNHNNGSFPLQIPAFHFLLGLSSLHGCGYPSRHPLKLRSTIATTRRVTLVIRAAGFPCSQPDDPPSDEDLQGKRRPQNQQGSPPSDISSSEGKAPTLRQSSSSASHSSSSLSGNPSTSPENSTTITFTLESNGGNQLAASSSSSASHVQSSSCDIAGGGSSSPPRFKKLSHMSKGIKAAFDVFQGWKVIQKLHAPEAVLLSLVGSPSNWVLSSVKATKFVAKGLKMSQKVLTSGLLGKLILKCHPDGVIIEKLVHHDLASLARGFNAFYAAIKVAEFSRSFGQQSQEGGLPDARFIWKGYKFSKSLVSILDAVVGKNGWALTYVGKGFFIVKKTIGGIGVMVKAIFLSKELGTVVLKRLAIPGGTFAAVLGIRHQASNHNPPAMDAFQQSKSKGFLCMTLVNEGYFGDLVTASFRTGLFRDDSLFSLFRLARSLAEDSESVHSKYSKEDDVTAIFCLALPLPTNKLPACA